MFEKATNVRLPTSFSYSQVQFVVWMKF